MRKTAMRLGCVGVLALTGCGADENGGDAGGDAGCVGAKCDDPLAEDFEARNVCVGIRGNGQLIFAHFAALSRIVEHYGLVA